MQYGGSTARRCITARVASDPRSVWEFLLVELEIAIFDRPSVINLKVGPWKVVVGNLLCIALHLS